MQIAGRRRSDLREELAGTSLAGLTDAAASAAPARDLLHRLAAPGLHLVAEVKRRSPSAGELPGGALDISARARAYEAGGAAAISVLVEPHWFGGSLEDLRAVRAAISLPILAKDFVVDPRQLPLLREAGADLVLLLASLHPTRRLQALVEQAREVGLEPLVEVHATHDLAKALSTPARLIGLNSRDLRTLRVHAHQAARLRQQVPDDRLVVAESGLGSPAELVRLRSLGFDAALVGSALMSVGDRPDRIRQRTAAFVAAGRSPDATDPAAAARRPSVKICGITDAAGIAAAISAGADAIGLNFVPGTPRALGMDGALDLVRLARSLSVDGRSPRIVGIFADADPSLVEQTARALGLDAVQLSGNESLASVARISRPVVKVLHLPGQTDPDEEIEPEVTALLERARAYLALPSVSGLLLDRAHPAVRGGTGLSADPRFVARIAAQLPVGLAGGLDAGNVAAAVAGASVTGVDVSSGVEEQAVPGVGGGPRKDPLLVRLFTKRARAARLDRPHAPAFPAAADPGLLDADAAGRWGLDREFGGRFVPETLVAPLLELERAYAELRHDRPFWAELRQLAARYVGRPTPLYRADRLAATLETLTGRPPGSVALYLKREDLAHTGAHKLNNALGQVLLAQRLGRGRIIAETGAGQHGVATATACALLDLPCVVYMGEQDIRRQHPNVLRMRVLGAEIRPVTSGNGTLKDAVNEAIRDWVTNARTTHYVLGSAVGPHPYPAIVRDFQRVIGDEAAAQIREIEGRLPDAAVACLGGGSNAIGLFARFIGEPEVRLVGVEAAGRGMHTGQHAAALAGGRPGILHGSRSYLMQDSDGQVLEPHSISAGLDYPGIGPQLSALYEASRMEVLGATDEEALAALRLVARTEGILPALEPAHAIAALPGLLATHARRPLPVPALVLVGLSGRGDKDMAALDPA